MGVKLTFSLYVFFVYYATCFGAHAIAPLSQYGNILPVQNYSSNPFWTPDSPYNLRMPTPVYATGPEIEDSECQQIIPALIAAECAKLDNCIYTTLSDIRPTIMLQLSKIPDGNYATACAGFIDSEFIKYTKNYHPISLSPAHNTPVTQQDSVPHIPTVPTHTQNWEREMEQRAEELQELQTLNNQYPHKLTKASFPVTFADLPFTTQVGIKKQGYAPYKNTVAFQQFRIEFPQKKEDTPVVSNTNNYRNQNDTRNDTQQQSQQNINNQNEQDNRLTSETLEIPEIPEIPETPETPETPATPNQGQGQNQDQGQDQGQNQNQDQEPVVQQEPEPEQESVNNPNVMRDIADTQLQDISWADGQLYNFLPEYNPEYNNGQSYLHQIMDKDYYNKPNCPVSRHPKLTDQLCANKTQNHKDWITSNCISRFERYIALYKHEGKSITTLADIYFIANADPLPIYLLSVESKILSAEQARKNYCVFYTLLEGYTDKNRNASHTDQRNALVNKKLTEIPAYKGYTNPEDIARAIIRESICSTTITPTCAYCIENLESFISDINRKLNEQQ